MAINNGGTVVFVGGTTVGGAGTPAIFAVNQGGGIPVPIVTGASDPVDLGQQLQNPVINNGGAVVFQALGTTDPATNDYVGGYYEVSAGGGTPTAVYTNQNDGSEFLPPTINSAGQVAFILDPGVPHGSGDADPGQQVWRVDSPGATPVVLATSGGSSTISTFADFFASGNAVVNVDIDAAGKVVYNAELTDGTQGIYLSTGPGDMEPFVTTDGTGFLLLIDAAFGMSDAVLFSAAVANGPFEPFDGTDPNADYVFYDSGSDSEITQLGNVTHGSINASGQFAFTYTLTSTIDGSKVYGVAVATPGGSVSPTPTPTPTPTPSASTISAAVDATVIHRSIGQTATVTLTRTGDPSTKVKVKLVPGGALVRGVDYSAPSITKFKPGKSTATLTITPLAGGADGKVKLVIDLVAGYTLDTTKLAVKIKN